MGEGEAVFAWEGGTLVATEYAGGPWSPHLIQGSASAGLLARAVESMSADTGMAVSRLSFDLWRPAPVGPVNVETETLRDGRKVGAIRASLMAGGAEVARCTAVLTRPSTGEIDPTPVDGSAEPPPDSGRPIPEPIRRWSPFFTGVDTRVIRGELGVPGPAAVWFRLLRPMVEGEETSPLVQAVSAADLASGISAIADLRQVSFVNPELTVHLWRAPRDAWILVDAQTVAGDRGSGLAHARLSDLRGPFGRCSMVLLFERRSR